jgi:hypothetical protein
MRPIRRAAGVALVRPTAPWRDGMRDVAALNAANSKATRLGHADEPGRNPACPSRHGSSSWDAIYVGQPFRAVPPRPRLTPNQVWGSPRPTAAWSICS